jgi:hypothetical protein
LLATLVAALFVLTIWLPLWWRTWTVLERLGVERPLAALGGGILSVVFFGLLFPMRQWLPRPALLDGLLLAGGLIEIAFAFRDRTAVRERLTSLQEVRGLWWFVGLTVPLFALPRLGNEVPVGSDVGFYGLLFVDYGNLRAVANTLVMSPGLPQSALEGTGPLAYHWFFFAIPAWMSTWLDVRLPTGEMLTVATWVGAYLFFKTLSRVCALALQSAGRGTATWCDWGAAVGIAGTSLSYTLVAMLKLLKWDWFAGHRNHLLLNLCNSFSMFGNNTFGITLILVSVLALNAWAAHRKTTNGMLAALGMAWLPAYSATLGPAAAVGVGATCAFGGVSRPWKALLYYLTIGGSAFALLVGWGLFSGRSEQPLIRWDSGQFLRNVALIYLPTVAGLVFCRRLLREVWARLLLGVAVSAIAIPSLLMLQGGYAVGAELSMKSATLIQTCLAPFFVAWCAGWRALPRIQQLLVSAFLVLAVANTVAYAGYPAVVRLMGKPPATRIAGDYYAALTYLRRATPVNSIVIDGIGLNYPDGNPLIMIASRRAYLANDLSVAYGMASVEIAKRRSNYLLWMASGFGDVELAREFAKNADYLIVNQPVASTEWALFQRINEIYLYRSMRAPTKEVGHSR